MIPAPLLVVTDRHGRPRPLVETVRAVLEGGARWIWFRDRDMQPAARQDMAAALLAIVREAGGRLTVGGDAALAAAVGADGVHLTGTADPASQVGCSFEFGSCARNDATGERHSASFHTLARPGARSGTAAPVAAIPSLSERIAVARRRVADTGLVGLSAHAVAECRAAAATNADYVTLSPVFASASKPGYGPALGLDGLRTASSLGIPVLALGGIDAENARACRAAGAAGVAVMGQLMRAADPAAQARAILNAWA